VKDRVDAIVNFYETLTPASVTQVARHYASGARFKDPFNDVQGCAAIEAIFAHMFESLEEPRFVVSERVVQARQCFLVWEFRFRFRGQAGQELQTICGGSHLVFDEQGLISLHRDYWDAAEELYEKLPLLGALMRWLKRRVNA